MSRKDIETEELRQQLTLRLESIVRELFPGKPISIHPHEIRVGNKNSLKISRVGSKAGSWNSFEEDEGGDIFKLVKFALKSDYAEVFAWCKARVSIPDAQPVTPHIAKQPKTACPKKRADAAKKLWNACQPIQNTLAETYLRKRGITVELPDSLRFHPELPYFRSYNSNVKQFERHHPALIGKVQNSGGEVTAVHAVYLDAQGNKMTTEKPPKLSKGSIKGNGVYLGKPQHHAYIAEGIEDALSIYQIFKGAFIIAALGTGNLRQITFPECVKRVSIARDNDEAGIRAAEELKQRLDREGYIVNILRPPQGKDFNDYLQIKTELRESAHA